MANNSDNPWDSLTETQARRLQMLLHENVFYPTKGTNARIAAAEGVTPRAIRRTWERILKKIPALRPMIYDKIAPRKGS